MPDPITFITRLTDAEWDDALGGWHCPALQIPGAVVDGIYVEGSQVDSGKFHVLQSQHIIRWTLSQKPSRLAVIIKLTQELALESEPDKWKKRAIIFPFLHIRGGTYNRGANVFVQSKFPIERDILHRRSKDFHRLPKAAAAGAK